ncbi:MAG: hypothetical protein J7L94_05060, partial [Caldisericaceae bacterium]|nr:hypothetical protein [Caldisericaceae bacterium]
PITGRIIRFASRAVPIRSQNMIYGYIRINNPEANLMPNLLLEGEIVSEVKPVWHYLLTFFKSFLNG